MEHKILDVLTTCHPSYAAAANWSSLWNNYAESYAPPLHMLHRSVRSIVRDHQQGQLTLPLRVLINNLHACMPGDQAK
jgi:hypothetical protein